MDENGRLPIHVAAVFGQPVTLSFLIEVLSQHLCSSSIPLSIQQLISDNQNYETNSTDDSKTHSIDDVNQFKPNIHLNPNKLHQIDSPYKPDAHRPEDDTKLNMMAAANYLDANQWTPLHHASCDDAINYYQDCIKILLENGADPMLLTQQGKTALDLAYAAGRSQILVNILPKRMLIALLMQIDDIVPAYARKQFSHENSKHKESDSYALNVSISGSPKLKSSKSIRTRKGYSFMRRLADNMDTTSDIQRKHIGVGIKSENSNVVSVWRRILLNDNVELLDKLRDSMVWRQKSDCDTSKIKGDLMMSNIGDQMGLLDFESSQHLNLKQLTELFNDCYENGTGVFSYVQMTYQDILKVNDFRTILQSMTGLLTFKPLSTNKIIVLRPMYKSLLFLSIICGRFRVAEQLIRMRQFDILPTTILITLILRRLHKEPEFPHHMQNELNQFADRVESIAVDVLNLVFLKDNTPEKMICRAMLNVPLRTFGGVALLDLCARAKCASVLSLPCCQRLLDERWHGVLIHLPTWLRWTSKLLPLTGIIYLEYKAKRERHKQILRRNLLLNQGVFNKSAINGGSSNLISGPTVITRTKSRPSVIGSALPHIIANLPNPNSFKVSSCIIPTLNVQQTQPITTIYDRMAEQFAWDSFPRWHFILGIYTSPSMKFYLHSMFHLLFLMAFSIVCVYSLHFSFSITEVIALSYVLGYAVEELRQIILEATREGFADYFKDGWNIIDLTAITLTGIGFCIRMTVKDNVKSLFDEAHDVVLYSTRNLYMLGLNLFYMRTLYITSISPTIGPRLKMMADMLRKDLIPLLIVFAIFIFSYGVWFQGLVYPNSFYDTPRQRRRGMYMDQKNLSIERDKQRLDLLTAFGELFRRSFYSIFEVSILLEEETCEGNKYCGNERGFQTVIFFVLVVYIGIVNIILINLLIALFSNTVSRIDQRSTAHWLAGRYKMVMEYSERTVLPPPFNILCICYELLRCLIIGSKHGACHNRTKLKSSHSLADDLDDEFGDCDNSCDSEDEIVNNVVSKQTLLIKSKEKNNRRLEILMGRLSECAKSYKLEIHTVLKFILIQSFALQNRRHMLGNGGVTARNIFAQQHNQNLPNLQQNNSGLNKNSELCERLERIENMMEKFLHEFHQTNKDAAHTKHVELTKMNPAQNVVLKMPSFKLSHVRSLTTFPTTHIPTSKDIFQKLSRENSAESLESSMENKFPPIIKINKTQSSTKRSVRLNEIPKRDLNLPPVSPSFK